MGVGCRTSTNQIRRSSPFLLACSFLVRPALTVPCATILLQLEPWKNHIYTTIYYVLYPMFTV